MFKILPIFFNENERWQYNRGRGRTDKFNENINSLYYPNDIDHFPLVDYCNPGTVVLVVDTT